MTPVDTYLYAATSKLPPIKSISVQASTLDISHHEIRSGSHAVQSRTFCPGVASFRSPIWLLLPQPTRYVAELRKDPGRAINPSPSQDRQFLAVIGDEE
jgi:hypothetical protein